MTSYPLKSRLHRAWPSGTPNGTNDIQKAKMVMLVDSSARCKLSLTASRHPQESQRAASTISHCQAMDTIYRTVAALEINQKSPTIHTAREETVVLNV